MKALVLPRLSVRRRHVSMLQQVDPSHRRFNLVACYVLVLVDQSGETQIMHIGRQDSDGRFDGLVGWADCMDVAARTVAQYRESQARRGES